MKKRMWLALVLAVVMAGAMFAMVACGGGGVSSEWGDPVDGGTLIYQIGSPSYIEPTQTFESEGIEVVQACFDSLVQFDPITSELLPDVAESWESNSDATVWTFYLGDSKFHNGRDVTAADFKYAWERICDPANESGISYHLSLVEGFDDADEATLSGVKAIDAKTLEVTLSQPFGDFEYVVGHPCLAPLPKEEVEKDAAAFALMPIGNGPFMMAEPWKADEYVKVVKFAEYPGTQPHVDAIEFKIFAEIEAAYLEFQAGQIDFTQIPSGNVLNAKATYGESADGYTSNPGQQTLLGAETAVYTLLMNNTGAPFDNVLVRQAISLAINRQAICDVAYEGTRSPADNIVPPGVVGYEVGGWQYSKYDKAAAEAKLTEAGYPGGEGFPEIKLSFNAGAGHEDVMQLVQADLAAIGITAEFDTSDAPTYWDKAMNQNYDIGRSGWIADYPIMDNFQYPLLHGDSHDNYQAYKSDAFDAALDEARTSSDPDERVKLYQAANKIAGDDASVAPITFYAHRRVGSDRLVNFIYSPMGLSDFVSCWLLPAATNGE